MNMKKTRKKSKGRAASADLTLPSIFFALGCGAFVSQYTEFVFDAAGDSNGHTTDIPMWRIHMGSACLGSVAFIATLFCFEVLKYRSKSLALRLALPWLPLVGLTGLATIIHIPILIVITIGVIYAVWIYRRFRIERPQPD